MNRVPRRIDAAVLPALLAVGLLTAAPAHAAATITSFTPTSGGVGTLVTITGSGFVAPASVSFNGAAASSVTVVSRTQVNTRVPATAVAGTGPITVTTPGGSVTSAAAFTVTPGLDLPNAAGPAGVQRTVQVGGFGRSETVDIYFDGSLVHSLVRTSELGAATVEITIPADAALGPHTVSAIGRRHHDTATDTFTVRTDWDQAGYTGANNAVNPYEHFLDAGNVGGLSQQWSTTEYEPANAVASGGTIYVGSEGVDAFDEQTGAKTYHGNSNDVDSTYGVAAAGRYVYAAKGGIWRFDTVTRKTRGTELIRGDFEHPPVISGDLMYLVGQNGTLGAYNLDTGNLVWSAVVGAPNRIAPSVGGGQVVTVSSAGKVSAFDSQTGAPQWSFTLGTPVYVGAPVLARGLVFVSDGDRFYALRASDGQPKWTFDSPAAAPAVAGQSVYLPAAGVLYALNLNDGRVRWSAPGTAEFYGNVSVENGIVYASGGDYDDGSHPQTDALDASTGRLLGSVPIYSQLVVNGAVVGFAAIGSGPDRTLARYTVGGAAAS